MTESAAESRRATLLIGYGALGRKVFERLLSAAAPRGVLDWQEPEAGSGLGDRRLRDLALLHVPDSLAGAAEYATGNTAGGVLGDLYRQIQTLETGSWPEEDLAREAVVIAERMLSASSRARSVGAMPLGLDVIVVAHPDAPEVMGMLDRMLATTMAALANNANLVRALEGAKVLNFIEILDFENYWDGSSSSERVRQAVASSLDQWRKRRQSGQPSFGRVYLVDGRTADGIRDDRHRIDEISLFLELLLFEDQRGGELQHLWQPTGAHESPLATFGVRSMERSSGLLSRLAAARFAVDWLEDLSVEKSPGADFGDHPLALSLAPYLPAELDRLLGRETLILRVKERLGNLERELVDLWRAHPEQPEPALEHYEVVAREITSELAREAGARMETIDREHLADLRQDLEEGVIRTLHHARNPLPLGIVVSYLEGISDDLECDLQGCDSASPLESEEPKEAEVTTAVDSQDFLERARQRLSELAWRFNRFRRQRVQSVGLRQWWPLFSLALAAGAAPILHRLLSEIPPPDSDGLLAKAYEILQGLAQPAITSVVLFLFFWVLGGKFLQRRIEKSQVRAEAFYLDPDRGRLAGRLRAEMAPAGSLGAPIHQELTQTLEDMFLAVRGEVRRQLSSLLARLRERRREMRWLRDELRDFLALHGLDLEAGWHHFERRDDTGIRRAVERGEDLERMLERNPPTHDRFRSTQAEQRPFEGWQERHGETFLHPLIFLDRLSRLYDPSTLQETGALEDPGQDFLDFLAHHHAFDLAFSWKAQEGLAVDRRYCLLPTTWRGFPGVLSRLSELRIAEDHVLHGPDASRAYLFRLRTGVALECLLETPRATLRTSGGIS